MFEDTYKTISNTAEGIYKEKGSKFIATAYPVSNEEDIKNKLALLRKTYNDARHHCYAYVLGADKSAYRINDDGEPAGTAGRPIHGQIMSYDLTNILIVVVRYFGGTLLGVSGLIRAYKTATKEALENAHIVTHQMSDFYEVTFHYEQTAQVMKVLKEIDAAFVEQLFEEKCTVVFSVKKTFSNKAYDNLSLIDKTHVKFIKSE